MADRKKVIKGLEYCITHYNCRDNRKPDCPYLDLCEPIKDATGNTLMRDALALLKEQEAVKRTSRTGINGFSIVWTCGACGSDLHPNNAKAKYCSNCGREVKWDE